MSENSGYRHFTRQELSCSCGRCHLGPSAMDSDFMRKLVAMRDEAGFPFNVTSSIRCPDHNNAISTTGYNGPHTTGRAVDVAVSRGRAYEFVQLAFKYGMTGIGISQKGISRFIHIDDLTDRETNGPRPTLWSY